MQRRRISATVTPEARLRDLQFRSLDFSELVLRLESRNGRELVIQADAVRRIETVQDVLDFFAAAFRDQ